MMINQPPPPPYSTLPPYSTVAPPYPTEAPAHPIATPSPHPIGFEHPPPLTNAPLPLNSAPVPLNSGHPQVPTPNYTYPAGSPYGTDPLIQQQARIAALNATPRSYNSRWGGGFRSGDRKIAMIIVGVVGLVFVIIFLVLFFTVFTKANNEFDEAKKRQEEFHNKYFSNW